MIDMVTIGKRMEVGGSFEFFQARREKLRNL